MQETEGFEVGKPHPQHSPTESTWRFVNVSNPSSLAILLLNSVKSVSFVSISNPSMRVILLKLRSSHSRLTCALAVRVVKGMEARGSAHIPDVPGFRFC